MADGASDLEIVNYTLTLEYLEAAFYQQVLDSGEITDRALVETAMLIAENEQEHVDVLMQTAQQLGEPAAEPETNFDEVIAGGRDMILQTAAQVENIGAASYLGQAGNIQDKEILAAALSIHTVEGRHAAALNAVIGESFVPDGAFAVPMSMDEVLEAVQPFIASRGALLSGASVQVEARHAARVRQLREQPITPAAFDEALQIDEVLQAVSPSPGAEGAARGPQFHRPRLPGDAGRGRYPSSGRGPRSASTLGRPRGRSLAPLRLRAVAEGREPAGARRPDREGIG